MSQAMESMWEMELGLMPFVLELFSAAIAYVYLLRRKGRFLSRVLLVCLLAALSPAYMMIFLPRENPGMEIVLLLHALFSVAAFGVLIFGIWFCFEVRLREALYCATCAYITEHVVYCLRILLDALGWRERLVLPFARGGIFAGISRGGQEDGAKSPL